MCKKYDYVQKVENMKNDNNILIMISFFEKVVFFDSHCHILTAFYRHTNAQ